MDAFIMLALTLLFFACVLVFAVLLLVGIGSVTEKALNMTDKQRQIREQEAERAQEPQNVLLRPGMIADAQPQTLLRPAMATEQTAPETLLRPIETGERE